MSNYSILVIDDEPDNFDVIEALLIDQNYTLHYANCGQEALAWIEKFDPDVILLDVIMPEMGGLETCRRIKSVSKWQSIPIIMVTALSSKENLANCLAAGADDFITKPVNSIELRARVQSMLRIKKQHDRIQSLSKLQRNNIHSLENNLNELRLDLAAGFPAELNLAMNSILKNIELMQHHLRKMSLSEVDITLRSLDKSAAKLNKLQQTFLLYLQLSLSNKEPKKDQICDPKRSIERIAILRAGRFNPSPNLVFDLEDTEIAVTPQHLNYIITELFERALTSLKPELYIHGRVIDNAFHFWIDTQEINATDQQSSKLSELTQFNSKDNEQLELEMSLKIVKKIVEIYDGLFLMAASELDSTTIYVILPLAMSTRQLPSANPNHV